MVYKLRDIVRDARVCLEQNMTSEALIESEDIETLSLDEIIVSKIEEAARRVESTAPALYLEEGHTFGDAIFWNGMGSGHVLLPDNFMRLIVFEMSDWERGVYAAISSEDPKYALQRQRIKALRGTAQRPVCAIVNRPEGKALEFYSSKSEDAYVKKANYIPYPKIEDGSIDISERCYEAVLYMIAALVATTYGENEKAQGYIEQSKSMFE